MSKIIQWYEDGPGKSFINEYTNINEYVMRNYKEMDSKEVSGIYIIKFNDLPIYIGESGQMGKRFVEHMYNLATDGINFFGVKLNEVIEKKVKVRIDILENELIDISIRKKKEVEAIKKHEPILQVKYKRYHPRDKFFKNNKTNEWLIRDEIRDDICIRKKLRRERITEALEL